MAATEKFSMFAPSKRARLFPPHCANFESCCPLIPNLVKPKPQAKVGAQERARPVGSGVSHVRVCLRDFVACIVACVLDTRASETIDSFIILRADIDARVCMNTVKMYS